MGRLRQLHFAHIQQLIATSSGCFIKNTGDGVLAAFPNAEDAVHFATSLFHHTGHALIRVRCDAALGPQPSASAATSSGCE